MLPSMKENKRVHICNTKLLRQIRYRSWQQPRREADEIYTRRIFLRGQYQYLYSKDVKCLLTNKKLILDNTSTMRMSNHEYYWYYFNSFLFSYVFVAFIIYRIAAFAWFAPINCLWLLNSSFEKTAHYKYSYYLDFAFCETQIKRVSY